MSHTPDAPARHGAAPRRLGVVGALAAGLALLWALAFWATDAPTCERAAGPAWVPCLAPGGAAATPSP